MVFVSHLNIVPKAIVEFMNQNVLYTVYSADIMYVYTDTRAHCFTVQYNTTATILCEN